MIYIVIPVHNRKTFTRECLKALQDQTYTCFRVIVVDDGSADGTSEMIHEEFQQVILLRGDGNLFWSAATNMGIELALEYQATYVMTLNDDTIPTPDFMEQMVYWSEKEPEALLGALAVDLETGKITHGGRRNIWKGSYHLKKKLRPEEQKGIHWTSCYPGRGLLIPTAVFHKIGLFDQRNFPQTLADIDFTMRAVQAGYRIFCNYDAKLLSRSRESPGIKMRENFSLKNYYRHLFDIRGGGNLKYYAIHVFKNCPAYLVPEQLFVGLSKRILGYPLQWLKTIKKGIKTTG